MLLVDALDQAEGRVVARRVSQLHMLCRIAARRPPPPSPPPPRRWRLQPAALQLQRVIILVEREQAVVVAMAVAVVWVVLRGSAGEKDEGCAQTHDLEVHPNVCTRALVAPPRSVHSHGAPRDKCSWPGALVPGLYPVARGVWARG